MKRSTFIRASVILAAPLYFFACRYASIDLQNVNSNTAAEASFAEAPRISPAVSSFTDALEITITGESGARLYYTLDGSKPTRLSEPYTDPIIVTKTALVNAIAVKEPYSDSQIATRTYIKTGADDPQAPYSAVNLSGNDAERGWAKATWDLGARKNGDSATFAVYSKNAEAVLLEFYDDAYGSEAVCSWYMEKNTADNIWRAEIRGVPNGALYGFRCWGPNWKYDDEWRRGGSGAGFLADCDESGNRFNPNKLLFDPYARELSHGKNDPDALNGLDAGMYATGGDPYGGGVRREFDTGKYAPKSVFWDNGGASFGAKPNIDPKDAVIYEAHVRGLTKHGSSADLETILSGVDGFGAVKNIPEEYRGTYKGAGLMAPYLKALGVNTIEFLPVHESGDGANNDGAPGGNFWGYMTLGYFAPNRRYSSDKTYGGPTREFKEMVKAFHDQGIEVYLDVVYNHSGEGGIWDYGKTDVADILFLRGFDNAEYYCLVQDSSENYWETSGCGNNLRCDNAVVRKFVLDSLMYWMDEMGVDGFRFDLATVLGRVKGENGGWNYSKSARTLNDIINLGNGKNAKMIAEAWDCGDNSYQVGNFPNGWGEWNAGFRDAIRGYIGEGRRGAVLDYVNGDYSHFSGRGGPQKSVNFVTSHDGFTLADLCSYEGPGAARNDSLDWPFGPSDGGADDYNALAFADRTNDDTQKASKRRAMRNYIALQMISRGVPMIVYGDELCRTQNGNNNPYNIDSVATWNNYNMINTASPHTVPTGGGGAYHNNFGAFGNTRNVNGGFIFTAYMLNLRKREPAFRQNNYGVAYDFFKEDGSSILKDGDRCVWLKINGGEISGGANYLVFLNMYTRTVDYAVPAAAAGKRWARLVDTASWAEPHFNCWSELDADTIDAGSYGVNPWSVVVLKEIKR